MGGGPRLPCPGDLNGDAAIAASALRVRAERKLGELLREQPKAPAGRPSKSLAPAEGLPPTLAEQGITYEQSSAYQRLAAAPEPEFEQAIEAEEVADGALPGEEQSGRRGDARPVGGPASGLTYRRPVTCWTTAVTTPVATPVPT